MAFLSGIQLRPLATRGLPGCETLGLALGQGQSPLEVVVLRSAARHSGRPDPVLALEPFTKPTTTNR